MNLTSLSTTVRKSIIIAIVAVIAFIIIRILFGLTLDYIRSLTPPPPPVANQLFGALATIQFSQPLIKSSNFNYSLETIDAKLPPSPVLMNVYQNLQAIPLFLGLDEAKKTARVFGFREEPLPVTDSRYQWADSENSGYTFVLDIVSGSFNLKLDPSKRPGLLTSRVRYDQSQAIERAKAYLRSHNSLNANFENGRQEVHFLNITPGKTTEASSADQANAFKVDLFPEDIDNKYPIITRDPDASPLNITLLAAGDRSEVPYEINSRQFSLETEKVGTYPIKDSATAWEELKGGAGVVVRAPSNQNQIAIHEISFGYYLEENLRYLKPVYIFVGNSSVNQITPDFLGVVPAIATPAAR